MSHPFPAPPQGRPALFYGVEESTTINSSAANDTVVGTANRNYTFGTLPSAANFYVITGIEVSNGTVVNGNLFCALESVNAIPPTLNPQATLAHGITTAQAGVSAVQRINIINSQFIAGGTSYAVYAVSSSATGRLLTATVGSRNNLKAITLNNDMPNSNATAWAAGTEEPYIKVYYKPVL